MSKGGLSFKGDWSFPIQKSFVNDPTLPPMAKLLYFSIKSYCGPDMTAWPSVATLAANLAVGKDTIYKAIAVLEERGLLKREQRKTESGRFDSTLFTLTEAFRPSTVLAATARTFDNTKVQVKVEEVPSVKEKTSGSIAGTANLFSRFKGGGNAVDVEEEPEPLPEPLPEPIPENESLESEHGVAPPERSEPVGSAAIPTPEEFWDFVCERQLDAVANNRPGIYGDWIGRGWQIFSRKRLRFEPVKNWRKTLEALNAKLSASN